jgi:hypothetical protein
MKSIRILILPMLAVLSCALLFLAASGKVAAGSRASVVNANLTFTTIDVPGAAVTEINGINSAGDMAGFYGQSTCGPDSGFLYSNGAFTYFNYPGQTLTVAAGINDSGLIVGSATQNCDRRGTVVGYLYDGTTFTTLQDGGNTATYGYGINNSGIVVGEVGSLDYTRGFRLITNGQYRILHFPGIYINAFASGINNRGAIVGTTISGNTNTAYIYQNGIFSNIDFPGAVQTEGLGINDHGIVVGWYALVGGCECAFALRNGKYTSFAYPGALFTAATGINKSGQIVGDYTFDFVFWHGFITSPITDADFGD